MDEADEEAPAIVLVQQIDYPSRAAMAEALTSPIRDQARAVTMDLMEHLEGRFYYFMSEGGPR